MARNNPHRYQQVVLAVLVGSSVATLLQRVGWGGTPLKQVTTEVTISASVFHDNFPTEIPEIEKAASQMLGKSGEDTQAGFAKVFRYLEWIPKHEVAQGNLSAARLVLEVFQKKNYAPTGQPILLRYQAHLASKGMISSDEILPNDPDITVLYRGYEVDFPRRNPRKLKADLIRRIELHASKDTIRRELEKRFLSKIAIGDSLDIDEHAQRLSVPSLGEMRVTEYSRLKVDLLIQEHGAKTNGRVIVSPIFYSAGSSRCRIHEFHLGADVFVPDPNLPNAVPLWHDRFMDIPEATTKFWVYMLCYDGSATIGDPDY